MTWLCVHGAQKGWYPGRIIDEIKEKRRSREIDKATLAAAAEPANHAPAASAAPVEAKETTPVPVAQNDKPQAVTPTDTQAALALPEAVENETPAVQPDTVVAAPPIVEPQPELEPAPIAAAPAKAESAQAKAGGQKDQHDDTAPEVDTAGAKGGWYVMALALYSGVHAF